MKKLIKLMLTVLLVLIIGCIGTGILIYSYGKNARPEKSDCIIVLGCQVYGTVPSPFLKSRLMEGIRLYNQGFGRYIIVSGAMGPGEDITEAQAMKDYLVQNGINPSAIIMEDKASSTYDNIINSKDLMDKYNLKSAVIVSNSYHLKRASLIAEKSGIKGSYSGVFVDDYRLHEIKGFLREIPALLKYYVMGR